MTSKPILILLAVFAVLGTGVYVMSTTDGNTGDTVAGTLSREDACTLAVAKGKELAPKAVGEVAAFRALDDPLDVSEISFKDKEGNPKSMKDWAGQTVVFNLWATWCPPCLKEMPYFETLQTDLGSDTFQVLPVSIDVGSIAKPQAFYDKIGLKKLPLMQDNTMEAFQSLRKRGVALGMPTTLLIDENGCAMGVLNGPAEWASDDAFNLIDAALALERPAG